MKKNLNKTVFITGGARRIGASIAKALVKLNFNVVIHYNKSKVVAEKLCKELNMNKEKEIAFMVKANLNIEKEIKDSFKQAKSKFGNIDCLINNASIFEYDNLQTVNKNSWNKHLSVNLSAPLILSKLFYDNLSKNTKGDIVNIIDQRVLNLTPHFLSYTISKSGLWTLTKTLALDLAPRVKVNAIGPGPVIKSKFQTDKQFMKQCKDMPLQVGSNPEEVAKTITFILSIKSMTGQIITLDGGQHLGWGQVNKKSNIKD